MPVFTAQELENQNQSIDWKLYFFWAFLIWRKWKSSSAEKEVPVFTAQKLENLNEATDWKLYSFWEGLIWRKCHWTWSSHTRKQENVYIGNVNGDGPLTQREEGADGNAPDIESVREETAVILGRCKTLTHLSNRKNVRGHFSPNMGRVPEYKVHLHSEGATGQCSSYTAMEPQGSDAHTQWPSPRAVHTPVQWLCRV